MRIRSLLGPWVPGVREQTCLYAVPANTVDPPKRSTTAFFMNFDDNSAVIYCYGGRIDAEPTGIAVSPSNCFTSVIYVSQVIPECRIQVLFSLVNFDHTRASVIYRDGRGSAVIITIAIPPSNGPVILINSTSTIPKTIVVCFLRLMDFDH